MVPVVGELILITGDVVSGIVYVTVKVSDELLSASSWAVIVKTFSPSAKVMPTTLQDVVPVAVPEPPLELLHATLLTPVSSEDVPLRVILDVSVP